MKMGNLDKYDSQDIRQFIEDLLLQHNKELIEKIKGMRNKTESKYWMKKLNIESSDFSYGHAHGYEFALNDILSLLEEKGEV